MKSRYKVTNITTNDSVSLENKVKACQQERKKIKDNVGLELPLLNLASQIPINNHENITREQVAEENTNADDARKMNELQMQFMNPKIMVLTLKKL
jgi:hypothetical protein